MKIIIFLFFLLHLCNCTYLLRNDSNVQYFDIPTGGVFTSTYSYPPVGFGCTQSFDNNIYFISSSYQYNHPSYNKNQMCNLSKKYVEIIKFDIRSQTFIGSLLIGDNTQTYPTAIGGKGNDNIVTCGIDKKHNILFYGGNNKFDCESNYNFDTSIVRVNLNTFTFIDRTILKNLNNLPTFSSSTYFNYKYINSLTTSTVFDGDSLWLGFGTYYTGILKLDITKPNIELLDNFQKITRETIEDPYMIGNTYEKIEYFNNIRMSFTLNDGYIYFIKDDRYGDSKILKINTSIPISINNSELITLDGINNINDIAFNFDDKKIYIVKGSLTSELYQYDFNFNKIKLNENCNVDFLKFPTEWGVITKIEYNKKTGFLYPIISTKNQQNGFSRINTKDLTLDLNTHKKFGNYINNGNNYRYYQSFYNFNISNINFLNGQMFILPNQDGGYIKKIINITLDGCAKGRGLENNTCKKCTYGKYSDIIGGICKDCSPGFASNEIESFFCNKCKSGKFTNGDYSIYCIDCPRGYYSNLEGSSNCNSCNKGTYSIKLGSDKKDDCNECQPGKISDIGSETCKLCEIGKWAWKKIICNDCEKGKYSFSTGLTSDSECLTCSIGKYSDESGLTLEIDCKICENGKIGIIEGARSNNSCVLCEAGKFKLSLTECETCPNGWISNNKENKCIICEIGSWAFDKKSCVECSKGKYSFSTGLISDSECKTCIKGKYNNLNGKTLEIDCKICENGKIGIIEGARSNDSCVLCEAGKFKLSLTECEICPNGWISNNKENRCIICSIGKFSNKYKISCLNCEKGKYNDLIGISYLDICKSCVSGKYSNILGANNSLQCNDCPLGRYSLKYSVISKNECKNCEAGRYKDNVQSSGQICTKCISGKISKEGSVNCVTCGKGKYSKKKDDLYRSCSNCPSGKFNILDGQGNINSCVDCLVGKWSSIIGSENITNCIDCLPGYYSETISATYVGVCIECEDGKFNGKYGANSITDCKECAVGMFSNLHSEKCSYCEKGKYTSTMGTILCDSCEEGKYSREKGSILCENCPKNSEQNDEKNMCICSYGSYNKGNNNTLECEICKDEFICEKNSYIETIKLKKNYWRTDDKTNKTYKCKNNYACRGGIFNKSTNSLCYDGHIGPVCDVCEKGWAKNDGICVKCPEEAGRSIGITILIPFICIIIVVFLIKTANPSENKKEEVNGVVKIFMNYAQVFSLASSFQINWPYMIRYTFERAKEFSSPRVSFYSSDCTIGWSYYDKLTLYLVLPIVYMTAVTFFILLITCCFHKKKKRKIKKMKKRNSQIELEIYNENTPGFCSFFIAWEKTAIVVGTFLSWPTVVEKTLEVLNCTKIGNKFYLIKDLSVECYTNIHNTYLLFSYIGIALYGVGIPLMGFKLLYDYRYRLFNMNKYDGSTPLSFLFLGYREKRWYYEFIIMGKKAGLILISVFLRNYARYQIIAANMLIQITFFMHVFLRPYDTITNYGMICNKLESISLLSLVMTLSTGLFFGTVDSGYKLGLFEDILIIMVLLFNGLIASYFLLYFIKLTIKTINTHAQEKIKALFDNDKIFCIKKCLSSEKIEKLRIWSSQEDSDEYGINLKNSMEKNVFNNFFKEKQCKMDILNKKIDSLKKRRLSTKLDKLRSDIQIMEKRRCWETIQNNRLYSKLDKMISENNNLNSEDTNKLKDIMKLYVTHGINYNEKMNDLYLTDLNKMLSNKTIFDHSKNIVISVSSTEVDEYIEKDVELIII